MIKDLDIIKHTQMFIDATLNTSTVSFLFQVSFLKPEY